MSLDQATALFAEELAGLFSGVFDTPPVLEIFENNLASRPPRIVISIADPGGAQIRIEGTPIFQLFLSYECSWNPKTEQMTIVESVFSVLLLGVKEPLWRYDFNRNMTKVPVAHLNVHAHRDEIAWARALSKRNSHEGVKVSKLHFPFGGVRFRPTIEDVLQMLIDEFHIDCKQGAKAVIEASRGRYFDRQLEAAVKESPAIAIKALSRMGFEITRMNSPHRSGILKSQKSRW